MRRRGEDIRTDMGTNRQRGGQRDGDRDKASARPARQMGDKETGKETAAARTYTPR